MPRDSRRRSPASASTPGARTRTTSTSSSRGANAAAARSRPISTQRSLRRYFAYLQTRGFGKADHLAQGRVGARVRALPAPPRSGRRATSRPRLRTGRAHRRSCRACRGATTPPRCSTSRRRTDPDDPRGAPGRRDPRAALRRRPPRERVLRPRRRVDVDLRRATVTVLGKGAKVRRLPLGEPAWDAVAAYLAPAARPDLARRADHRPVRERPWPSHDPPGRAPSARPLSARRRPHAPPARPAARLRDAPARGRGRSAGCSGAARTRRCGHDADLHSRDP